MKRKQIYLTEELDHGLKRLAQGQRRTESELIREAIRRYLNAEATTEDPWGRLIGAVSGAGRADESRRVDEVVYGTGEQDKS